MRRRIILGAIAIILLLLGIYYFKPITVYELIKPYSEDNLPKNITSHIFFSAYSNKELEIDEEYSIKELVEVLGNIQVRKGIISYSSYRPKVKNTYRFSINDEDNTIQNIYIMDSEYIEINNKTYKIVGTPDLSKFYEIIILAQEEGTLDEFYYELIDRE